MVREIADEAIPERVVGHFPVIAVREDLQIAELAKVVGGRGDADAEHMRDVADAELLAGAERVQELQPGSISEGREHALRVGKLALARESVPQLLDELGLEAGNIAEIPRTTDRLFIRAHV